MKQVSIFDTQSIFLIIKTRIIKSLHRKREIEIKVKNKGTSEKAIFVIAILSTREKQSESMRSIIFPFSPYLGIP